MNVTPDIKPVPYLKAKAADLLDQINDSRRPVVITRNGEPRAVKGLYFNSFYIILSNNYSKLTSRGGYRCKYF